jgi:hypothetical protein
MLKLTLTHAGKSCMVELDGVDISRYIRSIVVRADVNDPTAATLEYTGAVIVEGEAGTITLQQHEHFVTCDECGRLLGGEKQDVKIIDTSKFAQTHRSYAAVKKES